MISRVPSLESLRPSSPGPSRVRPREESEPLRSTGDNVVQHSAQSAPLIRLDGDRRRQRVSVPLRPDAVQAEQIRATDPAQRRIIVERSREAKLLGSGKDADVFEMPDYKNLVLRVPADAPGRDAQSRLHYVPLHDIQLPKSISESQDVGIPVAMLVPDGHPFAGRSSVTHGEALAGETEAPMMLLRKSAGEHPNSGYIRELDRFSFGGTKGYDKELDAYAEDHELNEFKAGLSTEHTRLLERHNDGHPRDIFTSSAQDRAVLGTYAGLQDAAKSREYAESLAEKFNRLKTRDAKTAFLAELKAGNHLDENGLEASKLKIASRQAFVAQHERLSKAYVEQLQRLAAMPQSSFDDVAKRFKEIESSKYSFDMDTQDNIRIHPERNTFQLFDIDHEKPMQEGETLTRFHVSIVGERDRKPLFGMLTEPTLIGRSREYIDTLTAKVERAAAAGGFTWTGKDDARYRDM